ncbi:penicillin-binding protein, partial [Lactobacillus sp. XV13L]|nr:penicillin-binding protein [Lactobacillus sp. XV13L]
QYSQAKKESVKRGLKHHSQRKRSNLRQVDDPYIKEAISEVKDKGFDPYRDNLKITINIDQNAQNKLYELANSGQVPFTNDRMQIGATVVDPANGHVVAILGGRHLPSSVQLGLDRAVQTSRSTGSSIKPVLDYAPAIEYLNWSTAKMLDDSRYVYPGTNIQLYDWDNRYEGLMNMRHALEQSRNVPAVKTLRDVGVQRAAKFARKVGINVPRDAGLSVAIGAD